MNTKSPWEGLDLSTLVPANAKRPQPASLKDQLAKAYQVEAEQEKAQMYLRKAMAPMLELLKIRLTNKTPLIVMRPIQYQTSKLSNEVKKSSQVSDEVNDSFYNSKKEPTQESVNFVDVVETIYPGTQLIFKSLDAGLQEFKFEDPMGNSYNLSYIYKDKLLTCTDIFETVQKYLTITGDNNE